MLLSQFSFELPQDRIAQAPVDPRDSCRLLLLDRATGFASHHVFRELPSMLQPGDCLVINETKVLRARLYGTIPSGDGQVEVMLLRQLDDPLGWKAMVRPGKRLPAGTKVLLDTRACVSLTVETKDDSGQAEVTFSGILGHELHTWLAQNGNTPLPPYIKMPIRDDEDYQTVYAAVDGSVAAPTAGLHFTPSLLRALAARGVAVVRVLLHVGFGTFAPLRQATVADNRMEAERFEVSEDAAMTINRCRCLGGRVIAVGTSVTRTLETVSSAAGVVSAQAGWADLFIYPGYSFRIVDGLLTNFHLPGSSPLLLASAVASWPRLYQAYKAAVDMDYRFYSFGDAMLVV